jgi:hypothetical protein
MPVSTVWNLRSRIIAAIEAVDSGDLEDALSILIDLERDVARAEKDTGDD